MPTDIISLTEFKNDASGWIERLQHQPPVVLTQNGQGRAVVQSYDAYRQQQFAMALMRRVLAAQAADHAGQTIPHEQVMAEVRARIQARVAAKGQATAATAEGKTPSRRARRRA
jgi:prevent-host-death family protein